MTGSRGSLAIRPLCNYRAGPRSSESNTQWAGALPGSNQRETDTARQQLDCLSIIPGLWALSYLFITPKLQRPSSISSRLCGVVNNWENRPFCRGYTASDGRSPITMEIRSLRWVFRVSGSPGGSCQLCDVVPLRAGSQHYCYDGSPSVREAQRKTHLCCKPNQTSLDSLLDYKAKGHPG